jgi:hypothetical protein
LSVDPIKFAADWLYASERGARLATVTFKIQIREMLFPELDDTPHVAAGIFRFIS